MPSGTKKFCQVCAQSGRQSRLKLYQINFNEAIQLCEDKACSFPLEASSGSSSIQQRNLSNVPPLRRKSSKGVKSALSTPFGTPTVLSPVSFPPFAPQKLPTSPISNGHVPYENSSLGSDSAAVNGIAPPVNGNCEELDLEGLLNSGAFDEPVKSGNSNTCVVNGFKEPLPLKTQNPPTNGLFSECSEFSKRYVTKSPKSLSRNPFDDLVLDIDENTNVFPFDCEVTNNVSFTNGLDFHQLTNGFNTYEEKQFVKFEKHLNSLTCDKLNSSLCTQDSESTLDAEVRSIFESSHQLFEKNNLWSSLSKDKMMAPIKDEETGVNVEKDEVMSQGTDQVDNLNVQDGIGGGTADPSVDEDSQPMSCSVSSENILQSDHQDTGAVSSQNISENISLGQSHFGVTSCGEVPVNNSAELESGDQVPDIPPEEVVDYHIHDADPLEKDENQNPGELGIVHENVIVDQASVTDAATEDKQIAYVTPEELTADVGGSQICDQVSVSENQNPDQLQQSDFVAQEELPSHVDGHQNLDEVAVHENENSVSCGQSNNELKNVKGQTSVDEAQITQDGSHSSEEMETEPTGFEMSAMQYDDLERNEDLASIPTSHAQQFETQTAPEAQSSINEQPVLQEHVNADVEAVSMDVSVEDDSNTVLSEAAGSSVSETPMTEDQMSNVEFTDSVQTEPEAEFVEYVQTEAETQLATPIQCEAETNVGVPCETKTETHLPVSDQSEDKVQEGAFAERICEPADLNSQEGDEVDKEIPNEVDQIQTEITETAGIIESIGGETQEMVVITDQSYEIHESVQKGSEEPQVINTNLTEAVQAPITEDSVIFQGGESDVITTKMVVQSNETVDPERPLDSALNSEQFVNIGTNVHMYAGNETNIVHQGEVTSTETSEINADQTAIVANCAGAAGEGVGASLIDDSLRAGTGKETDKANSDSSNVVDVALSDIQQTNLASSPFLTVSQHEDTISCASSQVADNMLPETFEYSTESEIIKTVDVAQPFQTIENVPILEQEVQGVTQTFETVSVSGQQHQFQNAIEENMVDAQQSHIISSAQLMKQEEMPSVSLNGLTVVGSTEGEVPTEGVLVSLPEQTVLSGDLIHNQIFTVPMSSTELPNVTRAVEFTGVDQMVTQHSDFVSQEGCVEALADMSQIEESSQVQVGGLETSAAITTQGIILQSEQLIDGAIYTLPTAIPNMPVSAHSGIVTLASSSTSDLLTNYISQSESSQATDTQTLHGVPIVISDSSTSISANSAPQPVGEETSVSQTIPPVTLVSTSKLNIVRDASNVTSVPTEQPSQTVSVEFDDTGPIPVLDKKCLNLFVQWQNRDAMCWLDVVMIVLCNSPTIQKLFTDDLNTEALNNSVLSTLLRAYYQAQTLMQKLTNKVHTDYKENLAKNSAHETDTSIPKQGVSVVNETPSDAADTSGNGIESVQNESTPVSNTSVPVMTPTDQPAKTKTTTVVNKISVKSMQDYFKAMDILDAVREKIWDVLQPRLQCERGKNDSPLFALPLLVREPAILKEKFKIRFKYTFNCDQCSYHQEDDHSKILPSFPEVPADFNMIEPCFVRNCFQCKTPGKRMKMTFASIPDMLLLHFKEGLPHCRLNELCFTFGGETYTVTAVIQYKNNPDHFVAWIRNGTGDQWMECDDLKSTLCQFITQEPAIPPNQIHIIMWEKNVRDDTARDLEETSACNILQSCLRVLQPDVLPGTSVVLPGKEALAQGLKRKAENANQNTVKYILSQAQGGKIPGIITLPPGASMGGMQAMKIVSLPPASSASGLLANVAGLSSATSAGRQLLTGGNVLQSPTGSFKPVILQSKNRPTILSSIVSSSASPNIFQEVSPVKTTVVMSQGQPTTTMRVIKSGNKIVYIPAEKTASNTTDHDGYHHLQPASSLLANQQVTIPTPQVASVSKVPNLKYIQLDKAQFPEISAKPSQVITSPVVGSSAKMYVVGSDGILQEVPKEPIPVKKHVLTASTPSPSPSLPGQTPKIIVRRKTESGEVVQSVVTNLDCKENSELMKAIESLRNGDADTGGALIQQLIKGKMISPGQVATGSTTANIQPAIITGTPKQEGAAHEVVKVINVKSSSPSVSKIDPVSAVPSSPFTAKYVKVGDNVIQIHSSGTPPAPPVGRGRGRGRGQSRGGRKKKPVPIMSNPTSVQKPIDLTSLQTSPVKSENQCIVISSQGQIKQSGVSTGAISQVVKVLSGPLTSPQTGTSLILGQPTIQTVATSTPQVVTSAAIVGQHKVSPVQTLTSPGKKITTLLASHLAQGGVSKKAVSVQSSDKSSPVKFILPPSGQALSPTKSSPSIKMKAPQTSPVLRTVTTLSTALPSHNISITSPGSQTPSSASLQTVTSISSPVQGISLQTLKGPVKTAISTQIQPARNITITPQTTRQASLQSVTSLINTTPVKIASPGQGFSVQSLKGNMSSDSTVTSPQASNVISSPVHTTEIGLSPVQSPGPPDVEVLSDSDGSKSPSKSPKYNPVISVQAAHGDAALLAKAIQTLVDKGVPIQQIQNQAFLSRLIATLKPKGTVHAAPPTGSVQIEGISARSLIQSSIPKQTVSGVRSTPQIGTSADALKVTLKQPASTVSATHQKSLPGDGPVSTVPSGLDEGSPSPQTDSSTGKTSVVIKPGQSYLAAVKPFLKLGPTDGKKGTQAVFDGYKLKSETVQGKKSDGGFTTIDMMKSQGKGNKKGATKSAPIVAPVPVVASTTKNIEEPIKDLILPQRTPTKLSTETTTKVETVMTTPVTIKPPPKVHSVTVQSPGSLSLSKDGLEKVTKGSIVLSPSKPTKLPSDIIVVETPGRGKKANPLHVIADAAVSRLSVQESKEDVLPQVTPPSGRGRGRGRGRPVKETATPGALSKSSETSTTNLQNNTSAVKDDVKSERNIEQHKRSFMDAFNLPVDAEVLSKERKVMPDDKTELIAESLAQAKAPVTDDTVVNTTCTTAKTPESFVKPKGRPRKQTLTVSPASTEIEANKTPVGRKLPQQQSPSPSDGPADVQNSRGRQRRQSSDAESTPNTVDKDETKARGRQPSPAGGSGKQTPEPRGRGRPRKVSSDATEDKTSTPEPKSVVRPRRQSTESPAETKTVSATRRQPSDSTPKVSDTPRGRGRPPKVSPSPTAESRPRGRPPKLSKVIDAVKESPKVDGLKVSKTEPSQTKTASPQIKTNTSEIMVVSEVKYVGKYKIHPVERPNTRRGGQRIASPGGSQMEESSPKSPAEADAAKPGKRRGRPPANPAKRTKTE